MGDEIKLLDVKVIQNGLLQIDILNLSQEKSYRFFCEPDEFFEKLGKSMKENMIEHLKSKGY